MAPTAQQVLAAVKRSGAKFVLCPGWDDPSKQAPGHWDPQYVIQHHTANGGAKGNNPSLAYILRGTFPPVRNCHFLIGRDGTVFLCYALKGYHAGKGGPGKWGDGPQVPLDSMNGYSFGIEIESKGMSLVVTETDGITAAQYDSLARLNAVLLDLIGSKATVGRVINHRTWAPGRKVDTRDTDAHLQAITRATRDRLNAKPGSGGGGHGSTGVPVPPDVIRLAELKKGVDTRSAYLVNLALHAEYPKLLPADKIRSSWSSAAQWVFRVYRTAHRCPPTNAGTLKALRILGAKHGFTVTP